jgi:transcriptional regulator with XRE-family HTH domain
MSTDYSTTLGQKIKELREAAGLGLRELARRADVSPSYLSEIEAGESEPTASKIQRISAALKVRIDKMLPDL